MRSSCSTVPCQKILHSRMRQKSFACRVIDARAARRPTSILAATRVLLAARKLHESSHTAEAAPPSLNMTNANPQTETSASANASPTVEEL
jgi:hypothetical protein